MQSVPSEHVAAIVFTSGSTGEPTEIVKHWRTLSGTTELLKRRFSANLHRATIVATVPPQHMYGLESTVLMSLHGAGSVSASQPFFPADIVSALEGVPSPRMLITTPFHLKALLESNLPLPTVDTVISATAPLDPRIAISAERILRGNVWEIYGCSEAGSLATRRPSQDDQWHTLDGVAIHQENDQIVVQAPHLDSATPLHDVLEIIAPDKFRFLSRNSDMVNVAGKRSSLAQLSAQLRALDGVFDGIFFLTDKRSSGLQRPAALVVTDRTEREIRMALSTQIDPVFMPRPLKRVTKIPRNSLGKVTHEQLLAALDAQ